MKRACLVVVPLVALASNARAQDNGNAPVTTTKTGVVETNALAPTSANNQMKEGFALELHMSTQLLSFAGGLAGTLTAPLVSGGIFAGYKLDRVIFGLGFDFTSADAGGAQIVMRWIPGVRVAIVRSHDERVELFGQLDSSFGHDFGSAAGNELIGVNLGPGVRYWVHPQFAFSAVGGWNADWNLYDPGPKNVIQGIFAGIQVLGVF